MKKILPIIIALIIIGGGAFYGGMKYAKSRDTEGHFSRIDLSNLSPEERQQRLQQLGAGAASTSDRVIFGGPRGQKSQKGGAGFVAGEILSKDDKSITIKLPDGGSKIVFFSDSTKIAKSVSGTSNDLEVSENITANGTANSDGSITAQSIQLRSNINNP